MKNVSTTPGGWSCATPIRLWLSWRGTSTEAFEDFFFNVCTVDYQRMGEGMKLLVERMEKTDGFISRGPARVSPSD